MNIIYAIVNLHTNPRTFSLTCTTLGCPIDLVIFGGVWIVIRRRTKLQS